MATATPGDSRYIALTTYRRDGRPVTTPVWAGPLEGKLYIVTAKSTGKTRRVRATGRVRFAPCNANGRDILGEWQEDVWCWNSVAHDLTSATNSSRKYRGCRFGPLPFDSLTEAERQDNALHQPTRRRAHASPTLPVLRRPL